MQTMINVEESGDLISLDADDDKRGVSEDLISLDADDDKRGGVRGFTFP